MSDDVSNLQVCIPVACVPSACWPYPVVSRGVSAQGGEGVGGLRRGVSQHAMGQTTSFAGGNYISGSNRCQHWDFRNYLRRKGGYSPLYYFSN